MATSSIISCSQTSAVLVAAGLLVAGCLGGDPGGENVVSASFEIPIGGIPSSATVATGGLHSCAVTKEGTPKCWGRNARGQLGLGDTLDSPQPQTIESLRGQVLQLAAAGASTCALQLAGTVVCWGANDDGQLGDGTTISERTTPTPVAGLTQVVSLAAGAAHYCANKTDGTVWCWGQSKWGQLGIERERTGAGWNTPQRVVGLTGVKSIGAGLFKNYALLADGSLRWWGDRSGSTPQWTPTVPSIAKGLSMGLGFSHTCVLATDRTVWCDGSNSSGEIGDGTTADRFGTPARVSGLSDVQMVSAGWQNSCALKRDGSLWCWGAGFGKTAARVSTPELIGMSSIPARWGEGFHPQLVGHSCGIVQDGTARCVGSNHYGQLGDSNVAPTPAKSGQIVSVLGFPEDAPPSM